MAKHGSINHQFLVGEGGVKNHPTLGLPPSTIKTCYCYHGPLQNIYLKRSQSSLNSTIFMCKGTIPLSVNGSNENIVLIERSIWNEFTAKYHGITEDSTQEEINMGRLKKYLEHKVGFDEINRIKNLPGIKISSMEEHEYIKILHGVWASQNVIYVPRSLFGEINLDVSNGFETVISVSPMRDPLPGANNNVTVLGYKHTRASTMESTDIINGSLGISVKQKFADVSNDNSLVKNFKNGFAALTQEDRIIQYTRRL